MVAGFQDASTAVGGPVADCGRAGVLPATYRLLYLRQTLLPPPDQLQGEQKVLPLLTNLITVLFCLQSTVGVYQPRWPLVVPIHLPKNLTIISTRIGRNFILL